MKTPPLFAESRAVMPFAQFAQRRVVMLGASCAPRRAIVLGALCAPRRAITLGALFAESRAVTLIALFCAVCSSLAACGGSQKVAADPAPSESAATSSTPSGSSSASAGASPSPANSARGSSPRRPGHLARSEVVSVLSGGLGAFLARLEVEPVVAAGKFRGWKIKKFRSGDPLWQNTELAPGDVVTRINGASIERPEQAFAVFQNLAVATQLRVEYERGGARRDLVYTIDDGP